MSLLVVLLALVLALSLLLVIPIKSPVGRRTGRSDGDDVDYGILEEAEEELNRLSNSASPEDADDELPDWGPGVPKRHSERTD